MLPSALLMHRYSGEEIVPKRLAITKENLALASCVIGTFADVQDKRRAELDER